jgi:hypothetical protein
VEEYYQESSGSDWVFYVVLTIATLIVICLLMNSLANLVERISPDLRTISPGQAWLSVIPVFGSFWMFYVVRQVSDMTEQEFNRRKIVEFENSPGLAVGWGFCFILFCAQLTLLIDTPLFTALLYIAGIVTLIVYWSKVAELRRKLDHDLIAHHPAHPFPQNAQPYQPPQNFPPQQYFPPHPFPPATDFPPPPSPPPGDEWERWKPK